MKFYIYLMDVEKNSLAFGEGYPV